MEQETIIMLLTINVVAFVLAVCVIALMGILYYKSKKREIEYVKSIKKISDEREHFKSLYSYVCGMERNQCSKSENPVNAFKYIKGEQ